ncbi:MAG TPA: BON domain-containing protein [Coleofasciculaceae cyanobacterium]
MNMQTSSPTRIVLSLIIGVALMGNLSACGNNAKTDSEAPNSTNNNGQVSTANNGDETEKDAQSKLRQNQVNADIRAREQRNNAGGDQQKRAEEDLASEVRSKLEANLPFSKLTVSAKDANVTISGVVKNQGHLDRIKPLAMEIKGVRTVTVKAVVAP